jgi:hypothetical protein
MSKCDLEVRFADGQRSYRPGDTVRGDVVVTTDQEVSCKALKIELGWHTHGIGNTDRQALDEIVTDAQQWSPGREYTYPFSFTAPRQPLTYHGHYLNVDHHVAARADLPWAIDPRVTEDYVLEAGPSSREDYLTTPIDFSQPQSKGKSSCLGTALGWLLAPLLIVLLLALLAALIPLVAVIGGAILLRRHLAERRVGRVTVELAAPIVEDRSKGAGALTTAARAGSRRFRTPVYGIAPGESVLCRVQLVPKADVKVNRIVAILAGHERCRSGVGTSARTHTHVLCQQELVLAEGASYMARMPVQLSATLEIPKVPAYSFRAKSNKLIWKLDVVIDLPNWADWTRETKLSLVPAAGAP